MENITYLTTTNCWLMPDSVHVEADTRPQPCLVP